jgi:hypothetical protein
MALKGFATSTIVVGKWYEHTGLSSSHRGVIGQRRDKEIVWKGVVTDKLKER